MDLEENVLKQVVAMLGFDAVAIKEGVNELAVAAQQLLKGQRVTAAMARQPVTLIEVDHFRGMCLDFVRCCPLLVHYRLFA